MQSKCDRLTPFRTFRDSRSDDRRWSRVHGHTLPVVPFSYELKVKMVVKSSGASNIDITKLRTTSAANEGSCSGSESSGDIVEKLVWHPPHAETLNHRTVPKNLDKNSLGKTILAS